MKTMLRIWAVLMALCMMLCLCACGNDAQGDTDVTTTAPTTTAPTEPTTEPTTAPAAEPDYKVTVVDEGGNPVVGAWVQLCVEDGTCTPASTDDNGVAGFNLDEYNYKVSFMVLPDGFEYIDDQQTWYFEEGKTEMTIVLKAVG